MLTPPGAPIANCFIESWIGSLKRECLNAFLCFALGHLDHIVQTYALYHNEFRPHQGLGNRPIGVQEEAPLNSVGSRVHAVRCRQWLGGLLKHYDRRAA